MPLSWNEIRSRAARFSHEWKDTVREEADAKPFLIDFLKVFDISERRYYNFEHRVKKINARYGFIDLFWPGMILAEMKSLGQDLDKAYEQALEYCQGLENYELPKLIMISDFHHFHVYDAGKKYEFELHDLVEHLQLFEEIAGYQKRTYHEEDPVNIAAAELMGKLHDELKEVGYTGTSLEIYLVRLVFILFADDSTIWQRGLFLDYVELRTKVDGSSVKELSRLEKQDLLILDDFGIQPFDSQSSALLMDIIEDRHGKHSTIIAGQMPMGIWHDIIGDQMIADSILDRLVNDAHLIELRGDFLRRKKNLEKAETEN
jgi:hypothetical protein